MLLAVIPMTYAGPPDRPSGTWRLVDAGSPLPRVGRPRPAASVPGTGAPAGAASRVGPGDLTLCGQFVGQHHAVEHVVEFFPRPMRRLRGPGGLGGELAEEHEVIGEVPRDEKVPPDVFPRDATDADGRLGVVEEEQRPIGRTLNGMHGVASHVVQ